MGRPAGTPADRLLRAAMSAAERGWPVMPLYPRSKRAVLRDWEHRATVDPETIRHWWAAQPYNIGIATGPAGLVVLDLDDAHGQPPPEPWAAEGVAHGRDVLAVLARRAGAPPPPRTYTVATPRGGEHRYFLAPAHHHLRCTVGSLGWRVDTRASGGYVTGAGSVHNGRIYTVADPSPVAPLPEWLVTALTPPPPREPAHPHLPSRRADAYLRAIVEDEADRVAHAVVGERNTTLFKAAATLGSLVAGGELDEHTARAVLDDAAATHLGVEGFTATESARTIDSGLRHGARQPRRLRD
ncbi:bifunctional DNA primase/polymerase [Streptoalloteichus hindustanus]|uniref:Bifunctional DNA primase/polymerase, N-terminal n=1 Tax=Streptoalloteichus hindustanus TaxID=2017 RepID=A0A1M5ESI1_STRHI|nr:bifunctional DNA primase/polymerase [Streptoalloteichus hindustanus]SHF82094.1 Bifunctional DNA primase/polymerase, N-terminal [Streptoalloteichus hindustanus]